jgi:hypothetical protein
VLVEVDFLNLIIFYKSPFSLVEWTTGLAQGHLGRLGISLTRIWDRVQCTFVDWPMSFGHAKKKKNCYKIVIGQH